MDRFWSDRSGIDGGKCADGEERWQMGGIPSSGRCQLYAADAVVAVWNCCRVGRTGGLDSIGGCPSFDALAAHRAGSGIVGGQHREPSDSLFVSTVRKQMIGAFQERKPLFFLLFPKCLNCK